jgi:hypothetical protein
MRSPTWKRKIDRRRGDKWKQRNLRRRRKERTERNEIRRWWRGNRGEEAS